MKAILLACLLGIMGCSQQPPAPEHTGMGTVLVVNWDHYVVTHESDRGVWKSLSPTCRLPIMVWPGMRASITYRRYTHGFYDNAAGGTSFYQDTCYEIEEVTREKQ